MKKVLVVGAAGSVGVCAIKYLLTEGKYEITVLDLKNKETIKKLKRFRKRVNIIYGDVSDRVLMEALVKDHDYIIYLASALPPLSNMKKDLAMAIDYGGCENITRAINYYNPKCHLFLSSSTSIYKDIEKPNIKSRLKLDEYDYFENAKIACEKLVKEKLKNYTIYRVPLVLSNPLEDTFIYHGKNDDLMDVITKEDCAYAFVKGIKYSDILNKKTFNLAGNESVVYGDLLKKLAEINGLSFKYVLSRLFLEKDYSSPVCADRDELENLIHFRNDYLNAYFNRLKVKNKRRKFQKLLVKKDKNK